MKFLADPMPNGALLALPSIGIVSVFYATMSAITTMMLVVAEWQFFQMIILIKGDF
jgi:hypothetical protein